MTTTLTQGARTGWAARIDDTQRELSIANQRFEQLISDSPNPLNVSKVILIVSIEAVALLMLLLTQILTIGKLKGVSISATKFETPLETVSNHQPDRQEGKASSVSIKSKCFETYNGDMETLAQDLSKRLDQVLRNEKISQAEWARRNDVSAKNVSLLRNYSKRKKLGLESIPKKELIHINELLPNSVATPN